jgi:hypothetical protein
VLLHNHGLKYLSEKKLKASFWASAGLLGAIRPKFENYLKGIEHRLKILEATLRVETERGHNQIKCKGLFFEYTPGKSYQQQAASDIPFQLAMDKDLCVLYGEASKTFAQHKDAIGKDKIEDLVNLCVMELQFMHGCDIDWNQPARGAAASQDSEVLPPALVGDDDDAGANAGGANGGVRGTSDSEDDEDEPMDFASIDPADAADCCRWDKWDYTDPSQFVQRRESFAVTILFFFYETLQQRFAKLSGQVHAGWKHEFKVPVSMDQLLERPEKINHMFEEREELWFRSTMQHYVSSMDEQQRGDMGITAEHLETLEIVPTGGGQVSNTALPM